MFIWLNKQGVKSDKGFIVQSVDRFTIQYLEPTQMISINVGRGISLNDKVFVNIQSDAFCKWDDGTYISKEKQMELLENFKDAMAFQDVEVIIDSRR